MGYLFCGFIEYNHINKLVGVCVTNHKVYSKHLIRRLCDIGDFRSQYNLIELVVRLTPSQVRMELAAVWNGEENLAELFKNISYQEFDQV